MSKWVLFVSILSGLSAFGSDSRCPVTILRHVCPEFPATKQYKIVVDTANVGEVIGQVEVSLPSRGGNDPLGRLQMLKSEALGRQINFSVAVPVGSGQLAGIEIDGKFHRVNYMRDGYMEIEGGVGEYVRNRKPNPATQENLRIVLTFPE